MKKILALLGTVVFTGGVASALDIVYPQGKYNQTYHDTIFFMGSVDDDETLYFQGEKVQTSKTGAFVVNVPLKQGRNQVFLRAIKDGRSTIKQFYITKKIKPVNTNSQVQQAFTPISRTSFKTITESVPLRYTPSIEGLNVMSELSVDTKLIVDGRQGDFFRVYLSPTKYGWVNRKDVAMLFDNKGYPAKPSLSRFYNVEDKTVVDLSMYRVAFSTNLPYEVVDSSKELLINVFNVAEMNEETLVLKISKNEWVKYNTRFSNGDLTLIMKNIVKTPGKQFSGLKIVLDAGHGGLDNGGYGIFRENEKDYNIEVATRLKSLLESKGAEVFMTRYFDEDVTAQDRVKYTKAHGADIFLSINMASVPQGQDPLVVKGTKVHYYNPTSKSLADSLSNSIVKGLKTENAGVVQDNLQVLQTGEYLAAYVELCNIVNPDDADIYKSPDFASNAALSLCNGLEDYIVKMTGAVEAAKLVNVPVSQNLKTKKEKFSFFKKNNEGRSKVKEVSAEIVTSDKVKKERAKDETPFLDTSVREKYQQEAIYVTDTSDKKWYRPNGKKRRAKRPAREIKHSHINEEQSVNIFASGDYEVYSEPEQSFGQKTRSFFSKVTSYFYNGARN